MAVKLTMVMYQVRFDTNSYVVQVSYIDVRKWYLILRISSFLPVLYIKHLTWTP